MSSAQVLVQKTSFTNSADVRQWMVEQARLDLVGPGPADTDLHNEALPQAPSRWYLTGFLVPLDAPDEQRAGDADTEGDLDSGDDAGGTDDTAAPDRASGRRSWRPSSMGLSFLVQADTSSINVEVTWGDYRRVEKPDDDSSEGEAAEGEKGDKAVLRAQWHRTHRVEKATLSISKDGRSNHPVPNEEGLELSMLVRPTSLVTEQGNRAAKTISLFLVNRRTPATEASLADQAFAFQVVLAFESKDGFLPRTDMRGLQSDDWDERLADLHYRDIADYAVGHNVAAEWSFSEGACHRVLSSCMPLTSVPRVVPNPNVPAFELGMETLGQLSDAADARAKLTGVVLPIAIGLGCKRRAFSIDLNEASAFRRFHLDRLANFGGRISLTI